MPAKSLVLSETMHELLELMERTDRSIYRYPGGIWNIKGLPWGHAVGAHTTATVRALVARGLVSFNDHREGPSGRFPVRATLCALVPAPSPTVTSRRAPSPTVASGGILQ